MSTNTWIGVGNLTKDPEMRYSQGQNQTAICRFSIAINDGYGDKQEVNYINIVAFGKMAESCGNYLAKGKKVAVTGRIKTGSYDNKQGQRVYTTDIIASSVEFLTPNQQQAPQQTFAPQQQQQPAWSNQWQAEQQNTFGQQNGFQQQPTGFGTGKQDPGPGFGQPEQIEGFAALKTDDVPF